MIEKEVSPNGKTVKVTFKLPGEVAQKSVSIVGDFNEWSEKKHPMKLDKKTNQWTKSISLKPGKSYQFRYYVDGSEWRNDESADRYVPSPFFSENGVVEV